MMFAKAMELLSCQRARVGSRTEGELLTLSLEIGDMQIERLIERTRERDNGRQFVSTSDWCTAEHGRVVPSNCTNNPVHILRIYECLGVQPGASFEDIDRAFRFARQALDARFLSRMCAPSPLMQDAAQALSRIETAYRLLSAPHVRERFMHALHAHAERTPQRTIQRALTHCAEALLLGSKAVGNGAKESSRSLGHLSYRLVERLRKFVSRDTSRQHARPQPVLRTSGNWKGRALRVVAVAGAFAAAAAGYRKYGDSLIEAFTSTQAGHLANDVCSRARTVWKESEVRRITEAAVRNAQQSLFNHDGKQ